MPQACKRLESHPLFYRNYAEATKAFQITLELDPNFPFALGYLGEIYCHQGKYEEAVALVRRSAPFSPPGAPWGNGLEAYCFSQWGKRREAERALKELQELAEQTYIPPLSFAIGYLAVEELDLAFHWLNKACDEHAGALCWLQLEPLYDPIRNDSRFTALEKRIGLPQPPPL